MQMETQWERQVLDLKRYRPMLAYQNWEGDEEELGAPNVNEFEPEPNPPKVPSFGTGGTGGI
jgi:hypothetical protein